MKFHSKPKEYFKGAMHHLYNRGVNKDLIFKDEKDYLIFLKRLRFYKNKYNVDILSYCLMPNHFHLQTRMLDENGLSKMMQFLTNSYAMYFNHKYKHSGHVFEGKFKAILIQENWELYLSRYVHLNPIASKLVGNLEDWIYSSYLDYIEKRKGTLCNKKSLLREMDFKDYDKFILEDIERSIKFKEYKKMLDKFKNIE